MLNVLLLTQNIGSIECNVENEVTAENQAMTEQWCQSVAAFVEASGTTVDVLVLHFQEMGGKKFHGAFNDYFKGMVTQCYPTAAWCSGLLAPMENDVTTFTAMGTVLFCSARVVDRVALWSFAKDQFVPVQDVDNSSSFFQSAKFSNAGTSRKGYLQTRLRIGDTTTLQFVNLHLLHDADNTVAASQPFPSEYVHKRLEAIVQATTFNNNNKELPLFLFGDWNMRLDTHGLKAHLEETVEDATTKIELEKKKIHASSQVWDYLHRANHWTTIREQFDKEPKLMQQIIQEKSGMVMTEMPIAFGPTYLLEDDPAIARSNQTNLLENNNTGDNNKEEDQALTACYQKQRFPAWCDRIWYNEPGRALVEKGDPVYWNAKLHPMDHLPVYLRFRIEE